MMERSESVLETLRRGTQEGSAHTDRVRLESAICEGGGHVVVIGGSQRATEAFVGAVVSGVHGYDVVHVSSGRAVAPVTGRPALVIVHDADAFTATQLETLRMTWEEGRDALVRVRLILLGSPSLEATLASEEGRALASRIGSTIRLTAGKSRSHELRLSRTTALRSGLALCAAVIVVIATSEQGSATLSGVAARVAPISAWIDKGMTAAVGGAAALVDSAIAAEPRQTAATAAAPAHKTTKAPAFVFKPTSRPRVQSKTVAAGRPRGERVAAWYTVDDGFPAHRAAPRAITR